MARSVGSKAVVALGKKLVAELGLDQSADTLGRWMAHYIAELMQAAETTEPETRPELMDKCCSAILDLWQHRRVLPDGKRPFENIEPILRALENLDPKRGVARYFRSARPQKMEIDDGSEAEKWLELVDHLDYSASLVIQHCLAKAAESALDKSQEWVQLAAEAGSEPRLESLVLQFLSAGNGNIEAESECRKALEDRVKRLDALVEMLKEVADEWRAQLGGARGIPSIPDQGKVTSSKTQ